jgi:hypothetical protein
MLSKTSIDIANELIQCTDGGTVWLHHEFTSGYVVALPNHELRLSLSLLRKETIQYYVENLIHLGAEGVGIWCDGGFAYIDSVLHFSTLSGALNAGKLYNQLAIFDIENQEVIEL